MLYDERDFRAVIFSCEKLKSIQSVEDILLDRTTSDKADRVKIKTKQSNVEAVRVKYHSSKCFIRTFDPAKRAAYDKQEKEGPPFEYDIFIVKESTSNPPLILVGVPFASMAMEVFGRIHKARPDNSFVYHRPNLEELVDKLRTPAGAVKGLRTLEVNWLVAGDSGHCDELTLRGADVAHSCLFSWLNDTAVKEPSKVDLLAAEMEKLKEVKSKFATDDGPNDPRMTELLRQVNELSTEKKKVKDLKFTLRKVEVRYDNEGGQELLTLSFDRFGNYMVGIADQGSNLPFIFDVISRLRKRKFLTSESLFPVRNRSDKPRL